MSSRTAVIIGATAGVGRALAEAFCEHGYDLVLAARGRRDLDAVCAHLGLLWGRKVHPLVLDCSTSALDTDEVYAFCQGWLGQVDVLLVPAGYADPDDQGAVDVGIIERTVRVNYLSSIKLISRFAQAFEQRGRGRIVGFSSVAAAAPRRRNLAYASAKAGLEAFLRGLRHHFAGTDVLVQCYALGYVDTAMSFGRRLWLPPVAPCKVAAVVLKNLDRDIGLAYYPAYWRLVVGAMKLLPWTVYKCLSF